MACKGKGGKSCKTKKVAAARSNLVYPPPKK